MHELVIPIWLLRFAVASVWIYEGLWCKLMTKSSHELEVIATMPYFDPTGFANALKMLGLVELGIAIWIMSGVAPLACALVQTALLFGLNTNGLLFARQVIHEPLGMIVRNFSFLVLVWVLASVDR
jgi:uncharacterized membrane protein YphA (DoxX/SURF4 family)